MHLYFDTPADFAKDCCRLLHTADYQGTAYTDWANACKGEHGLDGYSLRWLAAVSDWTEPEQVDQALAAEQAAILQAGQAHHALLADVAQALWEGVCGPALLRRLQPHFPELDLPAIAAYVHAAQDDYQKVHIDEYTKAWRPPNRLFLVRPESVPGVHPAGFIDPLVPAPVRVGVLLYQLLKVLDQTDNDEFPKLASGTCAVQPDHMIRFLRAHCMQRYHGQAVEMIRLQQRTADWGLEQKLSMLRATLHGIVSTRLPDAKAHLAAHFQGELPGADIVEHLNYLPGCGTVWIPTLHGCEEQGWVLNCPDPFLFGPGEPREISESYAQALLEAIDYVLHREISLHAKRIAADYDATLAALSKMDEGVFQKLLRQIPEHILILMLTCLPESAHSDKYHPLVYLVSRNMEHADWVKLIDQVNRAGDAPLEVFEQAEVLGQLGKIQAEDPQFASTFADVLQYAQSYPAKLPDIPVTEGSQLVERTPSDLWLQIGDEWWNLTLPGLRLLAYQLRYRDILRRDGVARFAEAWVSHWLTDFMAWHPIRQCRFLRAFCKAEADLFVGQTDRGGHWLKMAQQISTHPALFN